MSNDDKTMRSEDALWEALHALNTSTTYNAPAARETIMRMIRQGGCAQITEDGVDMLTDLIDVIIFG